MAVWGLDQAAQCDESPHSGSRTHHSLRAELAGYRDLLHHDRRTGAPACEITARWADLVEAIAQRHLQQSLTSIGNEELAPRLALVATGGVGRRDSSPFSDVDLILLHEPEDMSNVARLMREYVPAMFDAGLQLSHCVRTAEETAMLAVAEPTVRTSLVGSRLVWGNEALFERFRESLANALQIAPGEIAEELLQLRYQQRREACPSERNGVRNIKLSPGGLRDVHTLLWAGWLLTGEETLAAVARHLPNNAARQIAQLERIYWRLIERRLDFHFHHQTCNDFFPNGGTSYEALRRRADPEEIVAEMRAVDTIYSDVAPQLMDSVGMAVG